MTVDTARCPRCGGQSPLDSDDPQRVCRCGLDWGNLAPFPRADLDSEQWQYVTHLLTCRSGGRCEACGKPFVPGLREANRHHRRGRGMGGSNAPDTHSLANLLLLCAGFSAHLGGVLGCHGAVGSDPAWAEQRGLTVRQGQDPAAAPLTLPSGQVVLLDPVSPFYLPVP